MAGRRGGPVSEYIAIFVPWYWSEEYRKDCPEDFQLDGEEEKYRAAYGLTWSRWRGGGPRSSSSKTRAVQAGISGDSG
jgi:hypothetical protein